MSCWLQKTELSTDLKVLFRTDASLQIGSGHVMRCLTLAESLWQEGAEVMFACRSHPGNLVGLLLEKEFEVYQLPVELCLTNRFQGGLGVLILGAI